MKYDSIEKVNMHHYIDIKRQSIPGKIEYSR